MTGFPCARKVRSWALPRFGGHLRKAAIMRWEVCNENEEKADLFNIEILKKLLAGVLIPRTSYTTGYRMLFFNILR